jgi:hypothetical protein
MRSVLLTLDNRLSIVVHIPIMIAFLDHDSVVIPVVTLADNVTIVIPIAVTMTVSDGHADRTDADTDFFRASRHRKTDSSHGHRYHCKTLDH